VNTFFKIYLTITIFISGCATKNTQEMTFEASYIKSKGRSQNKPYYSLYIIGNSFNYNGIANMSLLGEHTFKVSKTTLNTLKKTFKESDFNQFEKSYIGNTRDLPLTYITYGNHETSYQEKEAPEKLKKLAQLIEVLLAQNNIKPNSENN